MAGIIELGGMEAVIGREFTHPGHIAADRAAMRDILTSLNRVFNSYSPTVHSGQPFYIPEPDGHSHRVVITQPEILTSLHPLIVVGFFGQKRPGKIDVPIDQVDDDLIAELPRHPGLLSYCTKDLGNGNYGNLVLFRSEKAKQHWGRSQQHETAVRLLAPDYYHSVRIYNGILLQGIEDASRLRLTHVKYFDYRDGHQWRAVRRLEREG